MGTNAAGVWDKAAKLLLDCTTQQPGSSEAAASLVQATTLIGKLIQLDSIPKAAWKKLVQQLKVGVMGHAMMRY
jgi:hypothetical protein